MGVYNENKMKHLKMNKVKHCRMHFISNCYRLCQHGQVHKIS